ncbi:hypothetical protein AB5J62_40640 [Amycolatopsis sp. cg5]|uniref:hypothetical protein n=1 Tax=Amycolatopsis sp. cg5 TaxID=3238802 RepID=UPI003524157B
MSRVGVAEAVRAAVTNTRAFSELESCPSARVRLFGAAAGIAYVPDAVEVARRETMGIGAITQRGVLDALMGLPVGVPVSEADLNGREQQLLRRAPGGIVECDAGGRLVRRAIAPMSVRFALVAASTWREGLRKAGRFAPFCARAMLLATPPADLEDARAQASFYGIGICVFSAGELQVLQDPQPYVRQTHTSAHWWFAEEIYRQLELTASPGA